MTGNRRRAVAADASCREVLRDGASSAWSACQGSDDGSLTLRAMTGEDVPFVVRQHGEHFPAGFFARLGPRFLTAYYRSFLSSPYACTLVADRGCERLGYLVGLTHPVAHRTHVLRRDGRALAMAAITALALRPKLARVFLRTRAGLYVRKLLRQPQPPPTTTDGAGRDQTAVLAHVVVKAKHRSNGVGAALIRRFDAEAANAGCVRVALVTAAGAHGAGPYYERRGWQPIGEHITPDGLPLTTYTRAIGTPQC